MMRINAKLSTRILASNSYQLGFGKKRVKVQGDLKKYDVVIVGGHLGSLLSSHLDGSIGQKASIFVAYDNPQHKFNAIRSFYEKGLFQAYQFKESSKNLVGKFAACSEGVGVSEFLPNENAVVLKSGRRVQYDNLVIATGLMKDPFAIKGFDEAWADDHHPFYTCDDHSAWKTISKAYRYMYNFNGGQAIYYIPPAPFHGQIESYNFLMAKQLWERQDANGKLCLDNSRFTVINANNSFCPQYSKADQFIKTEIQKKGINLEYGLKLVEVRKEDNIAVFENIQTGKREQRPYNNFYSLLPAKTDPILEKAGLADNNGLLNVNQYTLQHKTFENIFGFGDVANLPTTKTFSAGFNQLHVVRHNLERRICGLEPNAQYDGYSESFLNSGYDKMTKISHVYGNEGRSSLSTGFAAGLTHYWQLKNMKSHINLVKFKNWGPPFYKFKKTFGRGGSQVKNPLESLIPNKKEA